MFIYRLSLGPFFLILFKDFIGDMRKMSVMGFAFYQHEILVEAVRQISYTDVFYCDHYKLRSNTSIILYTTDNWIEISTN